MKIGITERGDAGLNFSWVDKIFDVNIVISKNLNDRLINELINNKEKIIFHMTCTGFGGSKVEPNVPNVDFTYNQIIKLIENFPVNQIVLRTDPIIPNNVGLKKLEYVLDKFKDTGIKRVRYSFLDMYPHVKDRFNSINLSIPYDDFCAPKYMINNALNLISKYENIYEFESCAENTNHKVGCISQKDFDILGKTFINEIGGFQRKGCMCLAGKTELLNSKTQCSHKCIYCYWK